MPSSFPTTTFSSDKKRRAFLLVSLLSFKSPVERFRKHIYIYIYIKKQKPHQIVPVLRPRPDIHLVVYVTGRCLARSDGADPPLLKRLLLLVTIHSGQKLTENLWKTQVCY